MRITISILILALFASCGGEEPQDNKIQVDITDEIGVVDSLKFYEEKLNADPENPLVLFERAKYYIRKGNVVQAQVDLEFALKKDSSILKIHKLYADVNLAKLDLEISKYHYDYVIKRDSMNTGAYTGLGKLYAALNNSQQAIYYLGEALKINPYLPEPYFTKGLIYRSDYYSRDTEDHRKDESWDRAVSSFQTAVEQDPNYYAAYIEMGVMYDEKGDSLALEYYNSAIDIAPSSLEAWYNKGMYYQNRGEVDNALYCYYTINDIDETWADPYYNLGYIHLLMTNELDSSIYYFERATQLDPMYYQAYNNMGFAYEKKGDIKNARKFYQKAVEINPDFQLAKDNLNAID